MNFDALTTAAVRDELLDKVLDGRIQKVLFPSEDTLGLEVYSKHQTYWLIASIHPQHYRVHLVQQKLHRAIERETPLLLLLRKYVRDGRITAIEQPPFERILIFRINKWLTSHAEQPAECRLIIEAMGRHSNIVLTDASGVVLE